MIRSVGLEAVLGAIERGIHWMVIVVHVSFATVADRSSDVAAVRALSWWLRSHVVCSAAGDVLLMVRKRSQRGFVDSAEAKD